MLVWPFPKLFGFRWNYVFLASSFASPYVKQPHQYFRYWMNCGGCCTIFQITAGCVEYAIMPFGDPELNFIYTNVCILRFQEYPYTLFHLLSPSENQRVQRVDLILTFNLIIALSSFWFLALGPRFPFTPVMPLQFLNRSPYNPPHTCAINSALRLVVLMFVIGIV